MIIYGTSYNGHNLVINERIWIHRMAKAIEYDEPLINYCRQLFY